MDSHYKLAIKNVAKFGDTDIFPFPVENAIFYDKPERVVALLTAISADFGGHVDKYPPVNLTSLAPAGYSGFRWATQLDPLWNAYLLSLVISYADTAEKARIPKEDLMVFSYRYAPNQDDGSLFDTSVGWPQFKTRSIDLADQHTHVLVCDIADFYQRVYHHRIDNALRHIDDGSHRHKQVMELLSQFSNNVSYGLPIGGPAARLLAELLLNNSDRLLRSAGLIFTRFVDDYHFFASSKEGAHQALVKISETLYVNEGLSLQKSKSRIMTSAEFKASAGLLDEPPDDSGRTSLLRLSLKYDPYSANPKKDYADLEKTIDQIDILGLLTQELNKTRIHGPLTKKLITAIRYLRTPAREGAVQTLVRNYELLSPLFGTLAITIRGVYFELDEPTQLSVHTSICALIRERSYIIQVDLHLGYAIRILGLRHSAEAEGLLTRAYESTSSPFVRKEIVLAMSKWRSVHWLSEKKRYFQTMSPWEKRAFVVASYCLGDEGSHWRSHVKDTFDPFTALVHEWAGERAEQIRSGKLPL